MDAYGSGTLVTCGNYDRNVIMAVVATGSKFRRNNGFIVVAFCLLAGLWFGYDGWVGDYHDEELAKGGGRATPNLLFNQYAPIPLALVAAYFLVSALRVSSQKIVAADDGLVLPGGSRIPYSGIRRIDRRFFEKEGHFTLEYNEGQANKHVKFSDRKYDNLGLLLDELVRRTGATPASSADKGNGPGAKS